MIALVLALTLAAAPTEGGTPPQVHALVERLQAFYEKTSDFKTGFRQEYRYQAFHRTQVSTGTVLFQKPSRMRWEYDAPGKKTVLLNGDKVFLYDPAAMTLTKANVSADQLSASVTFLMGKGKLADEFDITQVACAGCKGTLLELVPKRPDARFTKIQFEVDPASAQVLRSVVFDPTGDQNEIRFVDFRRNVGLTKEQFVLTPPANVQVHDFTQPAH